MVELTFGEALCLLFFGGLGALAKDVIADNALTMPKISGGKFILGSLGGILIGAVTGYFVDHSPLMAFCSGFTGFAALQALMPASEKNCKKNIGPMVPELQFPFRGKYVLTQLFGENPAWYKPYGYAGHFGLDIVAKEHHEIYPCDDGYILRRGWSAGNGNFVEIQHSWGRSLYLHMKDTCPIQTGLLAMRKTKIGEMGNTGDVRPKPSKQNPTAGTHLHFSIKINGAKNKAYKDYVDPWPFFGKNT